MEYLFECLQANLHDHLKSNLTVLAALSALYFATWNRSKLYALAFLSIECASMASATLVGDSEYNTVILGVYVYDAVYHASFAMMNVGLFALILSTTNSKSQRFICGMIVTLDVLMAIGYLVGGDAAIYLYDNYENIVFCLHVMLILSLYKPKPILRAMADKLQDFFRAIDSIIFMRAFWYTKETTKQEFNRA